MHPFYFGDSAAPLYGVYHAPREDRRDPVAVVMCYPFGVEYMRAHRAFRQLTHLLSRGGLHVLRFDYGGTGDSAGEGEDGSVDRWIGDIGAAVDEIRDTAGVERASLVGLRLGASLGALAARQRTDFDRVVLWDPIVSGERYAEELLAFADLHGANGRNGEMRVWPDRTVGIGGFPMTPALRAGIQGVDLAQGPPPNAARVDVIVSEERPDCEALSGRWSAAGVDTRYRCVPSENRWAEGDEFGSALIPQDIIQVIVESLVTEAR